VSLLLDEDRVARETDEGDVGDFDGVDWENAPAFLAPDEIDDDAQQQADAEQNGHQRRQGLRFAALREHKLARKVVRDLFKTNSLGIDN